MRYAQIILDFILKKDYDFGRSDVCLTNFHPQMYVILAAQGIFFGRRDSNLRFLVPFLITGITIVGLVLQCLNIYMGLTTSDYSIACECFCYLVMLGTIIPIYSGFLMNSNEILSQVEKMEADFKHVCSLGPRYREPFLEGQLLVWKLFVGWTSTIAVIGGMFLMYPVVLLLHQSLIATQDEHMKRPLAFPVWLPTDDPYRTPNYEIFFFLETVYCALYVLTFSGYVYTLFHFLLHYYTMMDMIVLDFEVIFDGLDKSVANLPKKDPRRGAVQLTLNKRIKRIVTWHLSIYKALKTVSSVFRPPLIYQLMLSSVALCLTAYQIAEKLDNGEINILFTMLGIGVVTVTVTALDTLLPRHHSQEQSKSTGGGFAVGDACWTCGWHETSLGRMIRVDIVIMIMRAQMPIFIKYTGQPVVQLETFSAIISTSYSYFNMLRQSAK